MTAERLHGDGLEDVDEIIAPDVAVTSVVFQFESVVDQPFAEIVFKDHVVAVGIGNRFKRVMNITVAYSPRFSDPGGDSVFIGGDSPVETALVDPPVETFFLGINAAFPAFYIT